MALNPAVRAMVEVAAAKYPAPDEQTLLLEWMTPLGKRLGDCTGHEIAAIAALFDSLVQSAKAQTTRRVGKIRARQEAAERELIELEAAAALPAVKPRIRVRAVMQHVA